MAERLSAAAGGNGYRVTPNGYQTWEGWQEQPEYEWRAEQMLREQQRGNRAVAVVNQELAERLAREARMEDASQQSQSEMDVRPVEVEKPANASTANDGTTVDERPMRSEVETSSAQSEGQPVSGEKVLTKEALERSLRASVDRNGNPYYNEETIQRILAGYQDGQPLPDPRAEEEQAALEQARAEERLAKERELAEIFGGLTSEQYFEQTQTFVDMMKGLAEKFQGQIDTAMQRNATKVRPEIYRDSEAAAMWQRRLDEVVGEIDNAEAKMARANELLRELNGDDSESLDAGELMRQPVGKLAAGGNADLNDPKQAALPIEEKDDTAAPEAENAGGG